jgi:TonB family protein
MNPNVHTAEVLPPRAMLFVGIVGFHVVIAYFLTQGLLGFTIQVMKPRTIEVVPIDTPPPTPLQKNQIDEPTLTPTPPVVIPKPIFDVTDEPTEPVFVATTTDTQPIGPAIPVAPAEPQPIRLAGRNTFPDVDSFYPPDARRRNVEGTALVRACVDESARLDGSPVIETSTGSEVLDSAAIRVAKQGRYARSLRGETAVPNCHRFRVTFALH